MCGGRRAAPNGAMITDRHCSDARRERPPVSFITPGSKALRWWWPRSRRCPPHNRMKAPLCAQPAGDEARRSADGIRVVTKSKAAA